MLKKGDEITNQLHNEDHHFLYKNGRMYIPRVRPYPNANEWLQSSLMRERKQVVFQQTKAVIRLDADRGETADADGFLHLNDFSEAIKPDEIEVKPLFFGVRQEQAVTTSRGGDRRRAIWNECSGVVVGVGSILTNKFAVGDAVVCWGGAAFSSRIRVPRNHILRWPEAVAPLEASTTTTALATLWYALKNLGDISEDQTVLVHNAFSISGQAAVQIAQYFGARIMAMVPEEWMQRMFIN